MPRIVKEAMASGIGRRLEEADTFFVTRYQGFSVQGLSDLRGRLRKQSARFMVVKNSVARRVLKGTDLEPLSAFLDGPSALAVSKGNVEAVSKVLVNFIKDQEAFAVRGALAYGEVWDSDTVTRVAQLPSRDELVAKAVGQIKAPISGLVGGLSGILRKLVGTLAAVQEKRS